MYQRKARRRQTALRACRRARSRPATSWRASWTGSPRASTPSGAASAPRPSSPVPPWSSCACAGRAARAWRVRRTRGHERGTWRAAPSTPWPPEASTTTWSGGSAATPPTDAGWCRTSRRCSPTRRSWPAPTCTPGRRPATATTSAWSPRPWTGCCASSPRPRARSTRPSMLTPAGSKGAMPRSPWRSSVACSPAVWSPRRPSGTASPRPATGRAGASRCAPWARRWPGRPRSKRHGCCWPGPGRSAPSPPGTTRF